MSRPEAAAEGALGIPLESRKAQSIITIVSNLGAGFMVFSRDEV
jgi:hypothetical protein